MCTDIIIPIYNAFEATKECVSSVIASTDLTENSLVLINDCSPDKRIDGLLDGFKLNNPALNITVLKNEKNVGFVGTVNRGMRFSKNDVILLNSDTVVSKNWVEKIRKCAYSDKTIGTVTPLSNNATLASVPEGLQRNEIPENITLAEYNEMLEKCAYRDYPQLPTAHGFCMFIKREVLDLAGLFDEESFGKGYGEENDFSLRLLDYGYKSVLCDDTIVYHKESQSFNSEREKILEKHLDIIKNRYPQYNGLTEHWCRTFPIKHICDNVKINLDLYKRKNVLLTVHEFENTFGGTTLHMLDIINSLREYMNFHVLYPIGNRYAVHSYFKDGEKKTVLPQTVDKFGIYEPFNKIYRGMVAEVMDAFGIDTLHIHHMMGHYFDIIDVAKERDVYSVITLHDFYCVCPNQNLLFGYKEYCADGEFDCKKCLAVTGRASNDITGKRRSEFGAFLQKFDRIIVPSQNAKEIVLKFYSNLDIEVIEHGIELKRDVYTPVPGNAFNVAFIGVMCNHKGGYIIDKVIRKSENRNIVFHVFGKTELPEFEENRDNYIFHGPYKREELNGLLHENNINLICFLQIWPETYSYTLNEAVSAGIPVLTTNLGAGKERVLKYGLGWITESLEPDDIARKIYDISTDREEYEKAIEAVAAYKYKTVEEMAREYREIYDNSNSREPDYGALKRLVKENLRQDINAINFDTQAQTELLKITSSFKWRLVNRITVPRPVKSFLRRIYRKFKEIKRG